MGNPILLVKDVGLGSGDGITPAAPHARYKPGDVVKVARRKSVAHFPRELVVIGVVPPGFPPEWALADLLKEARPLVTTVPRRVTRYILAREGDPKPYITDDIALSPSGKPPVEIGSIARGDPVVDPIDVPLRPRP